MDFVFVSVTCRPRRALLRINSAARVRRRVRAVLEVRRARPSWVRLLVPSHRWREFMPGIRVKEGESFESALRRFKKKCEKAGILSDLRRHQHFEKPSERRKRKLNAAKRKNAQRKG